MVDHVVTSPSWQRGLPADCPMPTPFIWTACEVPLNGDIPEEHGTRQELGFALEDDDECLKFVQGELPEVIQMVRVCFHSPTSSAPNFIIRPVLASPVFNL